MTAADFIALHQPGPAPGHPPHTHRATPAQEGLQMTTTWTNSETGARVPVFVHGVEDRHGEGWARVNKGGRKTAATFLVRAKALDAVVA